LVAIFLWRFIVASCGEIEDQPASAPADTQIAGGPLDETPELCGAST